MKAFILAAGKGSRLLPLTSILPKPLLPVAGRPLIWYSLQRLKSAGVTDLVINLSHLAEKIVQFFEIHKNFGFTINFSEEEQLLGTGGGLRRCREILEKPFILCNADIICDLSIDHLVSNYQKQGRSILALSTRGKLSVAVSEGRISDFSGICQSGLMDNYAYFGQAVLTPEIFEYLPEAESNLVSRGFIPLMKAEKLGYFEHKGCWFDLGTKERMQQAENFLQTKKHASQIFTQSAPDLDMDYLNRLYQAITEV